KYDGLDRLPCHPGHRCGHHDAWHPGDHHARVSPAPAWPGDWTLRGNLRSGSHRWPGPWWTARAGGELAPDLPGECPAWGRGNRPFVMGCLSFFFFSAALFGAQPYWSLFMQNTWGLPP